MKKIIFLLLCLVFVSVKAENVCQLIAGAKVIAFDGHYLGDLSNQYSSDSILNEYGKYGSEYSNDSIWDEYGTYGGEYSIYSPFNAYAIHPPALIKNGNVIAYLTVNSYLAGALDPTIIKSCQFYN